MDDVLKLKRNKNPGPSTVRCLLGHFVRRKENPLKKREYIEVTAPMRDDNKLCGPVFRLLDEFPFNRRHKECSFGPAI